MKKVITIIFLLYSFAGVGQISNTKVVRVANSSTTFSETLSEGNILIDLDVDKTYLILQAVAGTNSISDLTENTHYKEIANANPTATDSTFVWVQADTLFVESNIAAVDSETGVKINENLVIEDDGTIRMDSDATVWRDELQPLIGQKLDNRKSAVRYDDDEFTVVFDRKDVDYEDGDGVVMNIQLNHDWDGVTPIEPHLHWFQSNSAVPNWLIGYRWHQNGQAKATDWTEQAFSGDGSAFDYSSGTILQITAFPSISPPATPTGVSSVLQLKLMRDLDNDSGKFAGNDPLNEDAHALSFDIHIKINTLGSRTEYEK